mgnify:FL=1
MAWGTQIPIVSMHNWTQSMGVMGVVGQVPYKKREHSEHTSMMDNNTKEHTDALDVMDSSTYDMGDLATGETVSQTEIVLAGVWRA